jgi:hypothetical protein
MTNSDEMYGTPGISDEDVLSTAASRVQDAAARGELPGEVLGVLTGQVPVKSAPIAMMRTSIGKTVHPRDGLCEDSNCTPVDGSE